MIIGRRIGLRAVESEDLRSMKEWRNRSHYRKYFREYRELNMENQQRWFEASVVKDDRVAMFAIEELESSDLIGVCGLCYINWVHRHADLSIYIGKDDIYIDTSEGGYAWETLDLLFAYGFDELNLHKVWTEIYAFDEKKHELFKAYGFRLDGILRDNYFYHGEYQDSHIFSILDSDWRIGHRDKF